MQTISLSAGFGKEISSIRLPSFSFKFLFKLGFASIVFLSIIYVFQMNAILKGTYLINSYDKKINSLSLENEKLEIKSLNGNSLAEIEALANSYNFEKTGEVEYIKLLDSQVVKK